MTLAGILYILETRRKIGSLAKSVSNFCSFYIDTPTIGWIIALGIRARPARYRRSREGKNLFYYIASITNSHWCDATYRRVITPVHAVHRNNLFTIKTVHNSSKATCVHHVVIHSALINCRSVVNKTQDNQLELVNNNLDLCILTETWIKEGDNVIPTSLCPGGYKSLSIPRHDKVGGGTAIIYKSKFNISKAMGQP